MTALEEIEAERRRQIEAEGWTAEHDDAHDAGELMNAAMCYFLHATGRATYTTVAVPAQDQRIRTRRSYIGANRSIPMGWPWEQQWWKPNGGPRRNLVKSGALMLAEKDRIERVGPPNSSTGHVDHKLALVIAEIDRLDRAAGTGGQ